MKALLRLTATVLTSLYLHHNGEKNYNATFDPGHITCMSLQPVLSVFWIKN